MNNNLDSKICLNCQTPLMGEYCYKCSQKAIEENESTWGLVKDFFGDMIHFDSKIFVTILPLLFRPGFLSAEYKAGKRVRYFKPLRLFLFLGTIYFVLLTMAIPKLSKEEQLAIKKKMHEQTDPDNLGSNPPTAESMAIAEKSWNGRLSAFVEEKPQEALLATIPFFAIFLFLLYYRSPDYHFYDHIVFLLHLFSFSFLLSFVILMGFCIWSLISGVSTAELLYRDSDSTYWLLFAIPYLAYTYIAMRKFYGQSWLKTLFKLVLIPLALILIFILLIAVSLLALALLSK